ncbi:MAG: hypothetical protein GXP53_06815 [Deltaproteobacteria bacterium]|nr:hypothetical protein [Deltaproteobacteria bacterium]
MMPANSKYIKCLIAILFVVSGGSGCGVIGDKSAMPPDRVMVDRQNHQALMDFEAAVQDAGVADIQDARIDGYPYFRLNRFLQSLKTDLTSAKKRSAWMDRVHELGARGMLMEMDNLPDKSFHTLFSGQTRNEAAATIIQRSASIKNRILKNSGKLNAIIEKAGVPSDYQTYARVIGGYPLSRWFILMGLKDLQKESKENFQKAGTLIDPRGNWYCPEGPQPEFSQPARKAILLRAVKKSALGIPEPGPDDLRLFFDYFAPAWHVFPMSGSDRIGRPFWASSRKIQINVSDPVVYRFHSFTRMNQDIFLQLNYVVWFPERPSDGFFDIYSGHIDGLIWRVTLDMDGRVLLYDSVHPCGCYHKYYKVSKRLSPLLHPPTAEPPLIFDTNIPDGETARVMIHLTGKEHFVTGLSPAADARANVEPVPNKPFDTLRHLPLSNGFKSMFDTNGLVPGTQRKERFLVWSSGVLSPGAMRQPGHHAMALVGKLYFDEPRLLEKAFEIK